MGVIKISTEFRGMVFSAAESAPWLSIPLANIGCLRGENGLISFH